MSVLVAMFACAGAMADLVNVRVTGEVEYNQIRSGPFAAVHSGDPVTVVFQIDSAIFVDSPTYPVRGFVIDPASFTLTIGSVTAGMAASPASYFSLRNNDPAVDGFLLTSMVDYPMGVPTDVEGAFGPFSMNYYTTYEGSRLESLDVLGAIGTYGYEGMSVFNMTLDDGPFNPIGMLFTGMEISAVGPACDPDVNCDGVPDQGDVACMILAVAGDLGCFCQADPDFNHDGVPDQGDVSDVILAVAGAPCP